MAEKLRKTLQVNSVKERVKQRRYVLEHRYKQSQPRGLDDWPELSPRSVDGLPVVPDEFGPSGCPVRPQPVVKRESAPLPTPSVAIHVHDVDGEHTVFDVDTHDEEIAAVTGYSPSSRLSTSTFSKFTVDEDVKSQLSFIMKEKLHSLAQQVQRRTSTVREGLLAESPDESLSMKSTITASDEHRPSLMSLIGLQKRSDSIAENRIKKWWLPLPSTIDPYKRLYMCWLIVVTITFLYNAFCIPLRSSYPYEYDENRIYWWVVDYTADLIYLIDMLLIKPRLRFMKNGLQIKDQEETIKHYLMGSQFKLDVLCLLPTDLLYIIQAHINPIVRLNRVLKINSFWYLFDMLDNSVSNPYAIRIARTFSYMVYIIHCNSCIYYTLSAWQAFGQIPYYVDKNDEKKIYLNKWVYNNQGNAYIRCFYFTAAVATSTGNNPPPTNVIEYIYMTFSWMMGVFVFALLLGQIRDIVSNANRNRMEYQRQMDLALSECKRLGLSKDLIERVRDWFIYTWEQQKTLDEKKLIEKLPLKLQTDLALSVHYNTLSKVKLFQDCDRALLRDLVLKLRPVIFLPGDMICKKGDVGKEMYIVTQGVLQVVGGENNEKVFAELSQGAVLGEISLLAIGGSNRRTASIRAKGYTTLFVLAKEDLNDVIKYYPQAQVLLKRKAAQMLKNDKKQESELEKDKDLGEKCRISVVVAEVLPKDNKTSVELQRAMELSERRRPSMHYPWSSLKSDDETDTDDSAYDAGDLDSDEDQLQTEENQLLELQDKKNI